MDHKICFLSEKEILQKIDRHQDFKTDTSLANISVINLPIKAVLVLTIYSTLIKLQLMRMEAFVLKSYPVQFTNQF